MSDLLDDPPDRGAIGRAMLARPHVMREVGAEYRGTVAKGDVVEVRAYEDTLLCDILHAKGLISSAEHSAAVRLAGLFHAAGLCPRMTGRYAHRSPLEGADGDDGDVDAIDPLDAYRASLRLLTATEASVVDAMLSGGWRGWMVTTLGQALSRLAKEWGIA